MVGKIGRFLAIAIFLLVAVGFTSKSFAEKPDAVPQMGTVQCGQTVIIYENNSFVGNVVTVTVSDFCGGLDSRFTGINASATPQEVTVPDGNTITATFSLSGNPDQPLGSGRIELECLGDSGKGFCIYKMEDISETIPIP